MIRDEIEQLRISIEELPQHLHKNIMIMLHEYGAKLSFNRNGCFVNMSLIDDCFLSLLKAQVALYYKNHLNNEFDATDSVIMPATISAAII